MLKTLREKREALKSRGNAGFTLMELIIVIAILGMLIGMLLPKFANYTDKAMGTAAGVDAKNILTIATAYNLDNDSRITLADLQAQTGLSGTAKGGKSLTQTGATTGAAGSIFTYTYKRGGASIVATINTDTSKIDYKITGADAGDSYDSSSDVATVHADKQSGRIAKALGF